MEQTNTEIKLKVVEAEGQLMFSGIRETTQRGRHTVLFRQLYSTFLISREQYHSSQPNPLGTFEIIRDGRVISNNGQLVSDPQLSTAFRGVSENYYSEYQLNAEELQVGDTLIIHTDGYKGNNAFFDNLIRYFHLVKEVTSPPLSTQLFIEHRP